MSNNNVLRRLFLAKLVESKLLSYEQSGFTDAPSMPKRRSKNTFYNKERLPSSTGGPIVICLDTSWSMCTSSRENLSKAIVLNFVLEAHKQGRACQVIAFAGTKTMETGMLTPNNSGLPNLLNFLSNSFGGGTDVTGALKHLIQQYDSINNKNIGNSNGETISRDISYDEMTCADVVLLTDGEIPDPPVSETIMKQLDHLITYYGVEIHGLLVGASTEEEKTTPLSKICTQMHDFLLDYDHYGIATSSRTASRSSIGSSLGKDRSSRRSSLLSLRCYSESSWNRSANSPLEHLQRKSRTLTLRPLYARNLKYDDYGYGDDDDYGFGGRGGKRSRKEKKNRNRRYEINDVEEGTRNDRIGDVMTIADTGAGGSFFKQVDESIEQVKAEAAQCVETNTWNSNCLEEERTAEGSCWKYQNELKGAISQVEEGLIERSEDARLVVLAMLAMEHVLLLGVPGTGKSVLGRRLAKLCSGGYFFQRLLTKFTTPEELFGPLSLRSLEQDEYRRVTTGFLPTASVAFLDEIFKANSAILNTLLTILNERKFDNAGGQEDCPIKCVVGASNELPDSDELGALFDRFLIRKEVVPVSDDGIVEMLSMSNPGYSPCDDNVGGPTDLDGSRNDTCIVFPQGLDDVIVALSSAAKLVHMDRDVCELIRDLRTFLRDDQNIDISDRRLVKASHLLKISAASHGRNRVDPIDCMLLQHCFWELPDQLMVVKEWLWNNLSPVVSSNASSNGGMGRSSSSSVEQFRFLLDGLRQEIVQAVRRTSGDVTGNQGGRDEDMAIIDSLREETANVRRIIQERNNDLSRYLFLLGIGDGKAETASMFLWQDPDESQAMKQLLLPQAQAISDELGKTLSDVYALELSIQKNDDESAIVSNDCRLSVIEGLWEDGYSPSLNAEFTEDELLNMGMKEAKAKYDLETFRKWKRARKKLQE